MFKLQLPASLITRAASDAVFDLTDRIGQLKTQPTPPTAAQHRELLNQRAVAKRLAEAAQEVQ